ncbi:MAG TPA: helix-turn-helix transcriptional regulator [Dehalococcoidia bacterium]|nr:helix-turn-helix transcriptional regulator [Dehalococcoidia bacterium]
MPVGAEIRRRRQQQGLSLTDLARLAGVSKGYLSQIEAGAATRPSAQTLFKLAKALGTSMAELLGEQTSETAPDIEEMPASLREFAREANLPEADLRMLAGIRYRGRAPRTKDDWRFVYESIRRSTEGR